MNTLPQGVSGFGSPLSARPWNEIRKSIIQTVYRCNASVVEEWSCDYAVTPNYHFVQTSVVSILIHNSFPFLAFTENPDAPYLEIDFCEWEEFGQIIGNGWRVLPIDFLNRPLSPEMTESLSADEQNQIHYWRPNKIGDVIFNNWD